MSDGILWLNDSHGTPNTDASGYHETLTMFWLLTIEEFVGKTKYGGLAELANRLIAVCDAKLPFKFYSRERLFSADARARYVEPDLQKRLAAAGELAFSI